LALEEYEDAITQFYSVEYNSPDPKVGWRPLAWALFLNGEYESSLSYYDKLLSDSPTGTDYLNAGHAYLASKQVRDAVVCYMKSIAKSKLTVDSFLEMMK
jgi:tetratricopeptide (TPR) repeat protein